MNLNKFMDQGISLLVKTAGRFYLNNPRGIAFLAKMAPEIKKSARKRDENERGGVHIPPLIIASITSACNLHCGGCYSRAAGAGNGRKYSRRRPGLGCRSYCWQGVSRLCEGTC